MAERAGPSTLPLFTSAERRLRFGPFPSVGDALRFVSYAATGALVIPWLGTWAWLPIVGAGFLLVVWQPGGIALDVALWARFTWWERALTPWENGVSTEARRGRQGTVRIGDGYQVAVTKCTGRPIAFLPPEELQQKFRLYREMLRSLKAGIVLIGVGLPVDARPWIPSPGDAEGADREARAGYAEMVNVLCRHRRQRRVYLLQWTAEGEEGADTRLEERVDSLTEHLARLGVAPVRLHGPALGAALVRFGWGEPAATEAKR